MLSALLVNPPVSKYLTFDEEKTFANFLRFSPPKICYYSLVCVSNAGASIVQLSHPQQILELGKQYALLGLISYFQPLTIPTRTKVRRNHIEPIFERIL